MALSQSRFDGRLSKDTTPDSGRKLDHLKAALPDYLHRYYSDRITRQAEHSITLHCPFHEDRNPSCSADDRQGTWLWKCFSCQRGGSVIDLHAESAGLYANSREAILSTAEALGIDLSSSDLKPRLKRAETHRSRAKELREKNEQDRLTRHLEETLHRKLSPYVSENWRTDLWESSPIWIETPADAPAVFLRTLFPLDAIIWMGEPRDSGQAHHARHFQTVSKWLEGGELYPRVTAGSFRAGTFSRSKVDSESSSFLIIESDDLIGHKPTNEAEREANKALSYALCRYCQDKLGLHLRAVIDTGNKSLHLWFDRPQPKAFAAVKQLAPGLRIDTGLLGQCATAPLRMPGCLHEKTKTPASLLYLAPAQI